MGCAKQSLKLEICLFEANMSQCNCGSLNVFLFSEFRSPYLPSPLLSPSPAPSLCVCVCVCGHGSSSRVAPLYWINSSASDFTHLVSPPLFQDTEYFMFLVFLPIALIPLSLAPASCLPALLSFSFVLCIWVLTKTHRNRINTCTSNGN